MKVSRFRFRAYWTLLLAYRQFTEKHYPLAEQHQPKVQCSVGYGLVLDERMDVGRSRDTQLPIDSLPALQDSAMGYPSRRHLLHNLLSVCPYVHFKQLRLTAGYLLAKILLAVLFLMLGIISLKTLATQ
jgi:hypothetical protein